MVSSLHPLWHLAMVPINDDSSWREPRLLLSRNSCSSHQQQSLLYFFFEARSSSATQVMLLNSPRCSILFRSLESLTLPCPNEQETFHHLKSLPLTKLHITDSSFVWVSSPFEFLITEFSSGNCVIKNTLEELCCGANGNISQCPSVK